MPLKIRYALPTGAGDVTVDDDATVGQVVAAIEKEAGGSVAAIKCGWPLKSLEMDQITDQSVKSLGLQRERWTVVLAEAPPATEREVSQLKLQAPSAGPSKLSKDDVPVLNMPETGTFLTMRVMEDDNSCMFRAVLPTIRDAAARQGMDVSTPAKLRRAIAGYITAHPDEYNEVVLEKPPAAYVGNLLDENTWGGSIELGIVSELFDIEVCVINVGTGRAMHMGEHKASRCVIVWSGIHYDRIVEVYDEHAAAADADFESCVWDAAASDHIVATAQKLCAALKQRGYFTDMTAAVFRCNSCMDTLVGEKAVAAHFEKTGHTNMEEIPDHGN